MAIEQDVLVIGGGLAGATAALAANRAGATTRLVSHKQSTLRNASGLIDILGYTSAGEGPVVDPFAAIEELPTDHPYQRAGTAALDAGLSLFDEVTRGYVGGHTDSNALVPTCQGWVKPTARYPSSVAPGLASTSQETLLVGFERLTDFDAEVAANNLTNSGMPGSIRGVTIEFPIELSADPKIHRFAHLLDDDEPVQGMGVRTALAEAVDDHLDGESRVGLPAVLGLDETATIRTELEEMLGVDVFEVPMGPPSIPGIRLETQLFDALDREGVLIETGNKVVDHEAHGDTVESVLVDRHGSEIPYAADQFVLATGGLVGKGIDSDRDGVREPIFDCTIAHSENRYDWFDDDAFGDHAFASFGVDPDDELRPRDESERVEFENLRAAGAILGNYDSPAEKSASGVSLATGYRAGRLAGDNA